MMKQALLESDMRITGQTIECRHLGQDAISVVRQLDVPRTRLCYAYYMYFS
jgi:hypothetical protein